MIHMQSFICAGIHLNWSPKPFNFNNWYVFSNLRKKYVKHLHTPTLWLKSRFFKSSELYCSNLPQNSNCGRELVQKSGVQIPIGESQIFLSHFLFIFIFSIKNWILTHKILFFIFFYQLNINKNRCIEQILFYFYVTC